MNKQQVIDLWRLSFNDTEEFIRLYFDRVYKEENTLVIEKDGQVVSALQMLPYTMTYYGTEISVAYISGACTLPSMRGKGLMRQLIQNAFEEMKYRSVAVTALIPADPWLFDYYREQGYTEVFDYSEETYIRPAEPVWAPKLTVVPPEVPSIDLLYHYPARPATIRRTNAYRARRTGTACRNGFRTSSRPYLRNTGSKRTTLYKGILLRRRPGCQPPASGSYLAKQRKESRL